MRRQKRTSPIYKVKLLLLLPLLLLPPSLLPLPLLPQLLPLLLQLPLPLPLLLLPLLCTETAYVTLLPMLQQLPSSLPPADAATAAAAAGRCRFCSRC